MITGFSPSFEMPYRLGSVFFVRSGNGVQTKSHHIFESDLVRNAVYVAAQAALACRPFIGQGNEKAADQAATDAMRTAFNTLPMRGRIVIGEGERDEAPMLYIGEEVGTGEGWEIDIAVDPLEGTTLTARNKPNALTVLAMTDKGGFLHAPDVYMQKLAVGAGIKLSPSDLDRPVHELLADIAAQKGCDIGALRVCILDRARHKDIIEQVQESGAQTVLIPDGDVSAVIATADPTANIDVYMGSGGAPEGVLAAAALQCIGGDMLGRLIFRNDDERARATKQGITDFDKIYTLDELAKPGRIIFAASGVTNGSMLQGVQISENNNLATTETLVMDSASKTAHKILTIHNLGQLQVRRAIRLA